MPILVSNPMQRRLICVLVLANIGLIALIFARSVHHKGGGAVIGDVGKHLPSGQYLDANGQILDTAYLLGSPVYVQFVNSHVDRQVESVKTILSARPRNKAALIFITNDAPSLLQRISSVLSESRIYQDREFGLRDAFGAPRCCEKWQLYDRFGQLKATGDFDSGDGASPLKSLADGDEAYSSDLLLGVLKALQSQGQLQRFNAGSLREQGQHS